MKYIRLRTASGVHREIDFIDSATYTRGPDTSYDAEVRNVDGEQSIYARARRRNIQLQVDGLSAENLEKLLHIDGDRQALHIEANAGRYTNLYVPFERSKDAYLGSIAAFGRASVATYLDSDGLIKEVASGQPRFQSAKIGKGILLEPEGINKLYPSHPSSGALVWAAQTGSPVVSWITSMPSLIDGKTGVAKVVATANDVIRVSVTVTVGNVLSPFVYVKGCNRVEFIIGGVTGAPVSSGNVQLTMDWQRIGIENLTATATTVTMDLKFPDANTVIYISGAQCATGAVFSSYIPTTTVAVTRPKDMLYYLVSGFNPIEGSVSMWLVWPRGNDYHFWYATSEWFGYLTSAGDLKFAINGGTTNFGAAHGCTAGDLVHVAWSWREDYAEIVRNGVVLATSTSMNRGTSAVSVIQLYETSYNHTPNTVVDDLRFDNRYIDWTAEYQKYSDQANLALMKLTQGRTFTISNYSLKPKEANAQYFDGTIDLEEKTSDPYHTLEVA